MNLLKKILTAGIFSILASSTVALANTYPSRPIKLVAPFPPGGGTDIMARALAKELANDLKQPVIVENRSGASGNIGASAVARSKADGYTLLMTSAPFAISPAIFDDLSFHPVKDFVAITQISTVPLLIVTRADAPFNDLSDVISMAASNKNQISYATFGVGSPPHLTGEKIQELADVQMLHVPYKGGAEALTDIHSGQVSIGILDIISMMPMVKSGRLKALAITGPSRTTELPDVPTLSEAGVNFKDVGWFGLFAPAGVPEDIILTLNKSVNRVLTKPEVQKLTLSSGTLPITPATTPEQWQKTFNENVQEWGETAANAINKENSK